MMSQLQASRYSLQPCLPTPTVFDKLLLRNVETDNFYQNGFTSYRSTHTYLILFKMMRH